MPAVVREFIAKGTFEGSLDIQRQFIADYREDIRKYKRGGDSTLEQDFFARTAKTLIPIEVKAKNGTEKSIRTLIASEKYEDIHCGIKFTGGNFGFNDNIYTFPYFCTFLLKQLLIL